MTNLLTEQLKKCLPQQDLDPEDQDLSGFENLVPPSLRRVVEDRAKDIRFASTITAFIADWAKEGNSHLMRFGQDSHRDRFAAGSSIADYRYSSNYRTC